jgi:hypothetical protein
MAKQTTNVEPITIPIIIPVFLFYSSLLSVVVSVGLFPIIVEDTSVTSPKPA